MQKRSLEFFERLLLATNLAEFQKPKLACGVDTRLTLYGRKVWLGGTLVSFQFSEFRNKEVAALNFSAVLETNQIGFARRA